MTSELLDQELSLEELEVITGAGILKWIKEKYEEAKEAVMGPEGTNTTWTGNISRCNLTGGQHPLCPESMQYIQPDEGGDPWVLY